MADENQARHVLAEMQARLARSAYDALDIQAGAAGPAEVRAAFLSLTKIYHPARFARMAPEIQRMANEVFLSLRAAHDQLARPKNIRQSGGMPVLNPKTSPELFKPNNTPPRTTPAPPRNPPPPPPAVNPPTQPRVNAPPAPSAAINPPTQPRVAPPPSATARSNPPPPPTAAINPPTQRPGTPSAGTPVRPGTAPMTARPQQHSGLKRPITPAHGVPVTQGRPAITRSSTPGLGVPARAAANASAEPELVGVYEQLERNEFEQARQTLNALIALQPRPRYRALLLYSVAREAQLAGRRDEARVDLLEALEIDPDLQLAKTALTSLFTRR